MRNCKLSLKICEEIQEKEKTKVLLGIRLIAKRSCPACTNCYIRLLLFSNFDRSISPPLSLSLLSSISPPTPLSSLLSSLSSISPPTPLSSLLSSLSSLLSSLSSISSLLSFHRSRRLDRVDFGRHSAQTGEAVESIVAWEQISCEVSLIFVFGQALERAVAKRRAFDVLPRKRSGRIHAKVSPFFFFPLHFRLH